MQTDRKYDWALKSFIFFIAALMSVAFFEKSHKVWPQALYALRNHSFDQIIKGDLNTIYHTPRFFVLFCFNKASDFLGISLILFLKIFAYIFLVATSFSYANISYHLKNGINAKKNLLFISSFLFIFLFMNGRLILPFIAITNLIIRILLRKDEKFSLTAFLFLLFLFFMSTLSGGGSINFILIVFFSNFIFPFYKKNNWKYFIAAIFLLFFLLISVKNLLFFLNHPLMGLLSHGYGEHALFIFKKYYFVFPFFILLIVLIFNFCKKISHKYLIFTIPFFSSIFSGIVGYGALSFILIPMVLILNILIGRLIDRYE